MGERHHGGSVQRRTSRTIGMLIGLAVAWWLGGPIALAAVALIFVIAEDRRHRGA